MLPRVSYDTERRALADACHRLADAGLVIATAGNLSVRAGDRAVVTPTGCVLSEVEPAAMTVVDLDGTVQDGGPAPTSELGLHLGVYRAMEWTGAVVHTHSPMATAVGCVLDELPVIHYQMLALGGAVRVAPYATFGSDALHENVLAALEGHTAALMQNHGALTCGADLDQAVEATFLLEWASNLYWHASRLGTPSILTDEQMADVAVQVAKFNYGGAGG
jgi:L-fuculose-phosphate aldolase